MPKVGETDFTVNWLVEAANRDLAGGIGNLTQRVVTMVHRYRAGFVPVPDPVDVDQDAEAVQLRAVAAGLPERIDKALAAFDLRGLPRRR